MLVTFTAEQLRLLNTGPDDSLIAQRKKQGVILSYIEGHDVIDTANVIFGFDRWGYVVTRLEQSGVVWYATVRLTVDAGDGDLVTREDVGVGLPAAKVGETPVPDAVETAIKASVTDGLKRTLRTFGAALGNELYGKDAQQEAANTSAQEQRQPQPAATDGDQHACPACGGPMTLRSGTAAKTGKPWTAWMCVAKCGQSPLWVRNDEEAVPEAKPAASQPPARAASADLSAVPPDQRWAALKRLLDAGPLRGKQQVDWTHGQVTDLGYSKLLEMAPEAWAELVRRAGDVRLATKQ